MERVYKSGQGIYDINTLAINRLLWSRHIECSSPIAEGGPIGKNYGPLCIDVQHLGRPHAGDYEFSFTLVAGSTLPNQ